MHFGDFISPGAIATVALAAMGLRGLGWRGAGMVTVLAGFAYWQIISGNVQQRVLAESVRALREQGEAAARLQRATYAALERTRGELEKSQSSLATALSDLQKGQEFQKGQLSMLGDRAGAKRLEGGEGREGRQLNAEQRQAIADKMPEPIEGQVQSIYIDRCSGLECLGFAEALGDALSAKTSWHVYWGNGLFRWLKRPDHGVEVLAQAGDARRLGEAVATALSAVPVSTAHFTETQEHTGGIIVAIGPP